MPLSQSQQQTLRQLVLAKGDVFEMAMAERLVSRGVNEAAARRAARECSNRIWRNSMASGAFVGVLVGPTFTPVAGVAAGGSMATFVGLQTLLRSDACAAVRDVDVQQAVDALNRGL